MKKVERIKKRNLSINEKSRENKEKKSLNK
jgi:hypothetical protein